MISGPTPGDTLDDLKVRRYHYAERLRDPAPGVNQPLQDPDETNED